MVAHKGKLYRIGGFTAHNKEDDKHDLRSVASFASFDPQTRKWTKLPNLPEPRSSHDAVVIGDQLYVVGGWQLGKKRGWHKTAWSIDLSKKKLTWKALPTPPFARRALSLGQLGHKLVVIGGMQQKGGPTVRVDIYDTRSKKWSKGPSLKNPNGRGRYAGIEGFGSSAFVVGKRLFVSTYGGNLQVLDSSAKEWRIAHKLEEDRFFHRMLPYKHQLVLVGGASMREGKRLALETVNLKKIK